MLPEVFREKWQDICNVETVQHKSRRQEAENALGAKCWRLENVGERTTEVPGKVSALFSKFGNL